MIDPLPIPARQDLPEEVCKAARRGLRLFPVRERSKLPLVSKWPDVATSDLACLAAWADEFPNCNWGIATGAGSGIVVIDVDGVEGRTSVANLKHQGLEFPSTLSVTTGREDGGEHRYYRMPPGNDIRNDQSGKIGPHIDVRGTGGFVVFPPSVHESGKQYCFVDPHMQLADLPAWLVERLPVHSPKLTATNQVSSEAAGKGDRTNTLVSLAGTMHRRGMSVEAITAALLAENVARCDPPLPEAKVRSIASDTRSGIQRRRMKTIGQQVLLMMHWRLNLLSSTVIVSATPLRAGIGVCGMVGCGNGIRLGLFSILRVESAERKANNAQTLV